MAFTMITLTAGSGYRLADGAIPRARIKATPVVPMTNGTEIVDQEVTIPLTSAGVATKTIAATTDASTTPAGNAYRFRVEVDGRTVHRFIAELPHSPTTVAISSLTELVEPPDLSDGSTLVTTSGINELIDDRVNALIVEGANITKTYNDGAGTLTLAAATSGASGIPASTADAKGDLIAGTANDTVARLPVGANGLALVAASGQTTGLQWAAPAPASHVHTASDVTSGTVATARLGSGTASSSTFLRGDQTWAAPGSLTTTGLRPLSDFYGGTGDHTTALAAAATWSHTNKRPVYIDESTTDYITSAPIVLDKDAKFIGSHKPGWSTDLFDVGAPTVIRPAASGFPNNRGLFEIGADGRHTQISGLRLRGYDVGTGISGIVFPGAAGFPELGCEISDVQIGSFTGDGITGGARVTFLRKVMIHECHGYGWHLTDSWYDSRVQWMYCYHNKLGGMCVEEVDTGLLTIAQSRFERSGQLPGDPNNDAASAFWTTTSPGIRIRGGRDTSFVQVDTDANNGPGVSVELDSGSPAVKPFNYLFSGCTFSRDSQGNGTTTTSGGSGIKVRGFSTDPSDWVQYIRFSECRVITGASSDEDPLDPNPSRGAWFENTEYCSVVGGLMEGVDARYYFNDADPDAYNWHLTIQHPEWGVSTPTWETDDSHFTTTGMLRDNGTDLERWNGSAWALPASGSSTLTVINAKTDYSAAGNGSTNDATALQNALTAAGASTYGGIVYLPPGIYMTAKYLTIPSNVTLMGAGMGVTTIKATSTLRSAGGVAPDGGGYSVLQATGGSRANIAIQDLTVDGNESADRAALAASGVRLSSYLIDMRSVTGLRIERVATRNTWTYNIAVLDSDKVLVTGCDVRDPGTTGTYDQLDGIHIWGSTRVRVIGNHVDNAIGGDADDGFACHVFSGGTSSSDVVFANNTVRGGVNGHGLQIAGDQTATITGVTVTNNTFWGSARGIKLTWFSGSGGGAIRDVAITGNTFRGLTVDSPIAIVAAGGGRWDDVAIVGNVIDGYGSAGVSYAPGISVVGGNSSRGVTIAGNALRNGYGCGIELLEGSPVRDYSITGNVIDMSSAAVDPVGIALGSSLDGVVSGNTLLGRSTANGDGIYLSSTVAATATNQIVTGNRVRTFLNGITLSSAGGNDPTATILLGNILAGNGTPVSYGTAAVTSMERALVGPVTALADAATIATDASLSNYGRVTLGGNRTLGAPTNPMNGQTYTWEIIQDGTGSRTLALNAVFALGTTISSTTLTTTASKRDFLTAVYNSTAAKWYVTNFVKGY